MFESKISKFIVSKSEVVKIADKQLLKSVYAELLNSIT